MPRSKQQSSTQKAVKNLKKHLEEIPQNMRLFSLCFRALYTDQAVGGQSEAVVKFRKIRDDTRQDAMVYLKCILPATTNFIRSIKEYFETYEALSYEEWREMLQDILKETKTHEDLAQTVLDIHHDIMALLKERHDKAKMVMKEFVNLQSVYHLSEGSPRGNMAPSIASGQQYEINKSAALTVTETLIPALTTFIGSLKKMAQFFGIIENDLESFKDKSEGDMNERKQSYYKVIRNSAKEVKSLCAAFYAVIPDVRTDFETLPSQDTDQNYVDKWLEKTLAGITSQTTLEALLGTSSVMGEKGLVDTGRQSYRKNNRSPTPADDLVQTSKHKPKLPPRDTRPSTPEDNQIPASKHKPKLPPRDYHRAASTLLDDPEPASSENKQAPTSKNRRASAPDDVSTSKNNPAKPLRNGPASTPADGQAPTTKHKPKLPPRDRAASTTMDDPEPATKNKPAPTSKNRRASAPDYVSTSKSKPANLPRNGPASTPADGQAPTSKNRGASQPVNNPVQTAKRKAPSPPKHRRVSKTADGPVTPSKSKKAPLPESILLSKATFV